MVNFEFIEVSAEEIADNQEAIKLLTMGAEGFGGITSVASAIKNNISGQKIFVLVKKAIKLRGAIYLTVTEQEWGRVLTGVLLGGYDFDQWYMELRDFYYKLANKYQCDEFMFMGRRGFKKYFSELQEAATVFRVILPGKPKNIK